MTITYLPYSPDYSDYRPAFSPCGKYVLYERTPKVEAGATRLWIYQTGDAEEPVPFLKDAPVDLYQTRCDWSWARNQEVAFTGYVGANGTPSVWLANSEGFGGREVPDTPDMVYPSWYPDGEFIAVMKTKVPPGPRTLEVDSSGKLIERLTNPEVIFSGMPSVCPTDGGQRIAFAGQKNEGQPYNQFNNQIFISDQPGEAYPLDQQQGRAPWWSPDGNWVAFESDRSGQGYAVYVARPDGSRIVQLTDPALGCQHPKWSPDGKSLVLAALQPGGEAFRIGILSLEDTLES